MQEKEKRPALAWQKYQTGRVNERALRDWIRRAQDDIEFATLPDWLH